MREGELSYHGPKFACNKILSVVGLRRGLPEEHQLRGKQKDTCLSGTWIGSPDAFCQASFLSS